MTRHRIIFLIAVLGCAFALFMTNNPLSLLCLISLLVIVVFDYASVMLARSTMKITAELPRRCTVGNGADLVLRISRPLPFVVLGRLLFSIDSANVAFRDTSSATYGLVLPLKRMYEYRVQPPLDRFGETDVHIHSARVFSPLGLFNYSLAFDETLPITVLPRRFTPLVTFSRMPQARSAGDLYDKNRHGYDVSEVFDVRSYQPGDSPSAIHWKLSGKRDELITKEFSNPSDYNLAVLMECCKTGPNGPLSNNVLNAIAGVEASLSAAILHEGIPHDVVLESDGRLYYHLVSNGNDLSDTLAKTLVTSVSETYNAAAEQLTTDNLSRGFTKVILVTGVYDEASWQRLAFDIDLTVLLIGDDADTGSRTGGRYDLILLDANDLHERFNHLDI